MKKIMFILCNVVILTMLSCELADAENEVVVSVNNIPEEVSKIYIAVLDGEEVLSTKTYSRENTNPDGSVDIVTSAGDNRTFIVVAVNSNGEAIYYAHNTTVVESEGEAVVKLSMRIAEWNVEASGDQHLVSYNYGSGGDYWESTGAINTKYIFWNSNNDTTFYETYGDSAELPIEYNLLFIVEFYPFGVRTRGFAL